MARPQARTKDRKTSAAAKTAKKRRSGSGADPNAGTGNGRDHTRRSAAVRRGAPLAGTGRLTQRYKVAGASVLCERRNVIGMWKPTGPAWPIRDMGLAGLCFQSVGNGLKPGTRLRLTLHLPQHTSIRLKGKLTWVREADVKGRHQHGVAFTDYDIEAWAVLRDVHAEYASEGDKDPPDGQSESQDGSPGDLEELLEAALPAEELPASDR